MWFMLAAILLIINGQELYIYKVSCLKSLSFTYLCKYEIYKIAYLLFNTLSTHMKIGFSLII